MSGNSVESFELSKNLQESHLISKNLQESPRISKNLQEFPGVSKSFQEFPGIPSVWTYKKNNSYPDLLKEKLLLPGPIFEKIPIARTCSKTKSLLPGPTTGLAPSAPAEEAAAASACAPEEGRALSGRGRKGLQGPGRARQWLSFFFFFLFACQFRRRHQRQREKCRSLHRLRASGIEFKTIFDFFFSLQGQAVALFLA